MPNFTWALAGSLVVQEIVAETVPTSVTCRLVIVGGATSATVVTSMVASVGPLPLASFEDTVRWQSVPPVNPASVT